MLSHVIHEHMVLNIVLCKMSFNHDEIKDWPDKLSNRNIIPFLLVPLATLNLKTGFFKHLGFIVSHGFIMMLR